MNQRLKQLMDERMHAFGMITPSAQPPAEPPAESAQSYGVQATDGASEYFVDLRFQNGDRAAFPYSKLTYLNYNAANAQLDLNFDGYVVSLYGTDLDQGLYAALMGCQVRWITEAVPCDDEQPRTDSYVEMIEIRNPFDVADSEAPFDGGSSVQTDQDEDLEGMTKD